MSTPSPSLLDAADRLWDAAWELDERRGDLRASEWVARKVRELMRDGRADDPAVIRSLADVVESRLDRERDRGAA